MRESQGSAPREGGSLSGVAMSEQVHMYSRRVLHYVDSSLPIQTGYTIRTHYLARAQQELGLDVAVCLALGGYRNDRVASYGAQPCTVKEGLTYLWFPPELSPQTRAYGIIRQLCEVPVRGLSRLRRRLDMRAYVEWIRRNWGVPEIVHAHSPASTGAEGLRMARRFGAAFVYEVRGFRTLSAAAERDETVHTNAATACEIKVAKKADRVVAICEGIAQQLIRGGVSDSKITIVPNAVNGAEFQPLVRNEQLAAELAVQEHVVFGYVTNVRRLEGLQTAIQAWPQVKKEIPNAVFVLVGDGTYVGQLQGLARKRGVEDSWRFVGRVPHSEVRAYYSLFDVFVVPRIPQPVCQIVTPLKPLEAMAMGIPVVASDVFALREMVDDGKTGLLFTAGDPASLASVCVRIGTDPHLRDQLVKAASLWVKTEREWSVVAGRYANVYRPLVNTKGSQPVNGSGAASIWDGSSQPGQTLP